MSNAAQRNFLTVDPENIRVPNGLSSSVRIKIRVTLDQLHLADHHSIRLKVGIDERSSAPAASISSAAASAITTRIF